MSERKQTARRRRYAALLAVAALLSAAVLVLLGAYFRWFTLPESMQRHIDLLPDANARSGTPNAGVSEPLEEDSFQVVINRLPTVQPGSRTCTLWAENPETNPHDLRVRLYLDETEELLGMTHLIRRGTRVDELRLDRTLPPGEYPVTARLDLFDDEQESAGSFSLSLTLRVLE